MGWGASYQPGQEAPAGTRPRARAVVHKEVERRREPVLQLDNNFKTVQEPTHREAALHHDRPFGTARAL